MNQFTMPCLDNFITIGDRTCETSPSNSGLYLSDLGGVNLELLTNLADGRYSGAKDYANAILRRAALYFQDQLKQVMASLGYQISQGFGVAKSLKNCSFLTTANAGQNGRGLVCKRLNSLPPFAVLFVENIRVKTAESGSATLNISDELGVVVWSKNITLQANIELVVPVLQEFAAEAIYITLDGLPLALSTYATNCNAIQKGCCGKAIDKQFYIVSGWDGMQTSANSYGLLFSGGVQCSFARVACHILPYVSEAILNLCHAEILDDILASPRINYSTLYADTESIPKQAEIARNRAKKSITAQVGAMLDGLAQNSPFCISCNRQTSPHFFSKV